MYVYYATANRNPQEVISVWQDICTTLDDAGIFEKDTYQSK